MKRWVLLEHRLTKDNPDQKHFDLLLEEKSNCRSWRLDQLPILNGPSVKAIPINAHKLHWLERNESNVSGGRGWAKRIEAGFYKGDLVEMNTSKISVQIHSKTYNGILELDGDFCRVLSF